MFVCLFVQAMGVSVEAIYLFYSVVGAIIFIVMSALAGAALRSTKSQVRTHTFSHILQTLLRTVYLPLTEETSIC